MKISGPDSCSNIWILSESNPLVYQLDLSWPTFRYLATFDESCEVYVRDGFCTSSHPGFDSFEIRESAGFQILDFRYSRVV